MTPYRVRSGLQGAGSGKDRLHRLRHDGGVEEEAAMLEVVQIVAQLLGRPLDVRCVGVTDLRPAGDTGLDEVPASPERNLVGQLVQELRPLGPRADDAHLATQDVPKLRELV